MRLRGRHFLNPRWRHQMETFSALLALCAGNSPVTGEFPSQRQVTWSFDVFFHLCLNKRVSKQSSGWWFETPSRSLWCHCDAKLLTLWHVGICHYPRGLLFITLPPEWWDEILRTAPNHPCSFRDHMDITVPYLFMNFLVYVLERFHALLALIRMTS